MIMRLTPVICLILFYPLIGAQTPLLTPVEEIVTPYRQVPSPSGIGKTGYIGRLLIDKRIVTYDPYDSQTGALTGVVRILTRDSLQEVGVIRPSVPVPFGGWGQRIALSGDLLAVGSGGNNADISVYDIRANCGPVLYTIPEILPQFGILSVTPDKQKWLIDDYSKLRAFRVHDGAFLGEWDVRKGTVNPGGRFMFTRIQSSTWNGIDDFYLTDLDQPGVVINLREELGFDPGYAEFYVNMHGDYLMIQVLYYSPETAKSEVIAAYHMESGRIVWQKENLEERWYSAPSADGRLFVSSYLSAENHLHVYDLATGTIVRELILPFETGSSSVRNVSLVVFVRTLTPLREAGSGC